MITKRMDKKYLRAYRGLWGRAKRSLRWLIPGIGVKRWLLLTLIGTTLIGVGLAILILDFYRTAPDTWWLPFLSAASLRFIARPIRALIFGSVGLILIITGIWGVNRSILKPFVRPGHPVVDALTLHRRRERGPRIVVIGGGHGLAILLRGLKEFTHSLTAVVTVADDGGSSGRLRREMGILPPGDIRNCLAALSNDEALLTQLFQYRFANGHDGLQGHSFGNLFISALAEITGSFEEAVAESGRVLSVHGRVLPSTLHDVRLTADVILPNLINEVRIEGESQIPSVDGVVRRVWLEPNNPPAFPQSMRSILSADLIVIGPGSLYTSILPNLLVPDIAQAVRASRALKIYVCNVATQPGETANYTCGDHVRALQEHTGSGLFDLIVVNENCSGVLPENSQWVTVEDELDDDYLVYRGDLVDDDQPWRHDSIKLSHVLIDLLEERTGPLVE
ncbi:MAG TPA: gluconeogenesis factor YvcK family protein [Anaerolineales bacterium]|nr:gluconeogenesis factor YvcK family protein [Anaerolineales bacterium]